MSSFFIRIFLLFWLPVLPFVVLTGSRISFAWTLFAGVIAWFVSKNSREVMRDFVAHVDSGRAMESPGEMDVRTSFLYGPLLRRFKKLQQSLGDEILRGRREKELLSAVLSNISDGVVAIDAERNVLFCNDSARKLCEIKKTVVFQKSVEEVLSISSILEMCREPEFFERPMSRKVVVFQESEEKFLGLASSPFGPEDHRGAVLTIRDLSEEARQERERREFVANASHDLKTPLTAIRGYLDTVLEGDASPEQNRKFLSKIQTHVDRLSELSQKLLILADPDLRGDQAKPIPLETEIEAMGEEYADLCKTKGLTFSYRVEGSGWVVASTDSLRVIFGNLLDNAIKFTPPPGRVSMEAKLEGGFWVVSIQDSGIGIDPQDQPRVFDRFFRSDRTRTSEGSGLGLAIVKKLVERLGGAIRVESQPDLGSRFEVSLPIASTQS